ncbi:hypothetical protein AJ79_00817 [Helicocarpus griseus UAMH5409]|uniref:F-box domain-containing protein n=1 Tax=Helicocarpus griseus UAMH5409 TaxID=1447875 RepID=A0A2B7YAH2_9EURO|nr:hypothetical protein AJ79_00817 [Helicocarpus griseus UAMH5409]
MASPLLNIPEDVLRLILASLSSANLWAVCLTHTALRTLAEPFLYSHIQWIWDRSHNPPIVPFLRTILRRPELALRVKSLILEGNTLGSSAYHKNRHKYTKFPVNETDLDELIKCIKGMNVPYSALWIHEIRAGTMDAFVALLLFQLPRLKRLQLSESFTNQSRLIGMVLRTRLCDEPKDSYTPSFDQLQDVSSLYFDPGFYIRHYTAARNTADVLPFFYLPSVERITAAIDNPTVFAWPAAHAPNPSRLASLDLAMIREGNLGHVLSVAKELKTLRWEWFYREDLQSGLVTDIIDLDQIAADLSHVRETLTDLTIEAESGTLESDLQPHVRIKGKFRAFSDLNALKRLKVPLPLLMGLSPFESKANCLAETLPKGMESLTITDDLYLQERYEWEDFHLFEILQIWLQDWKISTPHLQEFHLYLKLMACGEWGPEMRERLKNLGVQVGIHVKITKIAGQM